MRRRPARMATHIARSQQHSHSFDWPEQRRIRRICACGQYAGGRSGTLQCRSPTWRRRSHCLSAATSMRWERERSSQACWRRPPSRPQGRRHATARSFEASVFPLVDDPQSDSTFARAACRIYRYGSRAQWRCVDLGLRRAWQWTRNKHGAAFGWQRRLDSHDLGGNIDVQFLPPESAPVTAPPAGEPRALQLTA
jgi:hypothetical protein